MHSVKECIATSKYCNSKQSLVCLKAGLRNTIPEEELTQQITVVLLMSGFWPVVQPFHRCGKPNTICWDRNSSNRHAGIVITKALPEIHMLVTVNSSSSQSIYWKAIAVTIVCCCGKAMLMEPMKFITGELMALAINVANLLQVCEVLFLSLSKVVSDTYYLQKVNVTPT